MDIANVAYSNKMLLLTHHDLVSRLCPNSDQYQYQYLLNDINQEKSS